MRPKPNVLFGIAEPETPPQVCVEVVGLLLFMMTSLVSASLPRSAGTADQRSATSPTTCGPAIEVPLIEP